MLCRCILHRLCSADDLGGFFGSLSSLLGFCIFLHGLTGRLVALLLLTKRLGRSGRGLLALVDEDTAAFDRIMAAIGMPKGSEEEKKARAEALEAATLYATEVPLKTMKTALEVFPIVRAMASEGNPASVSDAGVGALAARSAVLGAQLNVRINAAGLNDREAAERLCAEAAEIAAKAIAEEAEVLAIVNEKI